MENIDVEILNGAEIAFIDKNKEHLSNHMPKLIVNNNDYNVLNFIKEELKHCDEFFISVAFIQMSGLRGLLQDLKELEEKGVKGKIITTDYFYNTEPEALKTLDNFSNIEIRLYETHPNNGFHTKGYIFKNNGIFKAIIGSSNITGAALNTNQEWNVAFSSLNEGEIIQDICDEFKYLWVNSSKLSDVFIKYENEYNYQKNFLMDFRKKYIEEREEKAKPKKPNSMQIDFLEELEKLYNNDQERALLVSATGTGKTIAAALAIKQFNPEKFLFLVHREQILIDAVASFKDVFQKDYDKFGILSGSYKQSDKDYLFSTVQTMSKEDVYTEFDEDEFDFIVIDEVHKAGSKSYLKLLNYFKPKFWLGMTASPERTDGFNIFELFDYNVPTEIRLQQALEEDLLCPFHYFGITDLIVDDEEIDETNKFNYLTSQDRVNYLLEKSEFYGYSGDRPKALVFCSSVKEGKELAKKFNQRGHPSEFLDGGTKQKTRLEAVEKLTKDVTEKITNKKSTEYLEYIFTVDIFNEGIDIPQINQILLVRPTQSPIVFIQQLGRGLRKHESKDHVVIIDFIGNYKNNFLIPIALSGDKTYNKYQLHNFLNKGSKAIPGASTINFDEISRQKIFESINNENFSVIAKFKEAYLNLKFKLGETPYLMHFYENDDFNPELILAHNKFKSYYDFLKYIDDSYDMNLTDEENGSLRFLSQKLIKGVRPHELIILSCLRSNKYFTIDFIEAILEREFGLVDQFDSIKSAINFLSLNFYKKTNGEYQKNTVSNFVGDFEDFEYENLFFNLDISMDDLLDNKSHKFSISNFLKNSLANQTYLKHFDDIIQYSLSRYEDKYLSDSRFKLYEEYSMEDVIRLLNWKYYKNGGTIGGYTIHENTCPIFITYKNKDESDYEDLFSSNDSLIWYSKFDRKINNNEIRTLVNYNENHLDIDLFIRKTKKDNYFYIGKAFPNNPQQSYKINKRGNEKPIVKFDLNIEPPVNEDIYNYFEDI